VQEQRIAYHLVVAAIAGGEALHARAGGRAIGEVGSAVGVGHARDALIRRRVAVPKPAAGAVGGREALDALTYLGQAIWNRRAALCRGAAAWVGAVSAARGTRSAIATAGFRTTPEGQTATGRRPAAGRRVSSVGILRHDAAGEEGGGREHRQRKASEPRHQSVCVRCGRARRKISHGAMRGSVRSVQGWPLRIQAGGDPSFRVETLSARRRLRSWFGHLRRRASLKQKTITKFARFCGWLQENCFAESSPGQRGAAGGKRWPPISTASNNTSA
jgi:hypothetical protein